MDSADTSYAGHLATHEEYWAGLDALPLLLGIAVYTWFWPPAILTPETAVQRTDSEAGDSQYEFQNGIPEGAVPNQVPGEKVN